MAILPYRVYEILYLFYGGNLKPSDNRAYRLFRRDKISYSFLIVFILFNIYNTMKMISHYDNIMNINNITNFSFITPFMGYYMTYVI